MSEPREKLDPVWAEVDRLVTRLRAAAIRLFASRGCIGEFTVLPGTGKCAADLVADTVGNLLIEGYWHPGTGGEDPFPVAYRMMYRDFLDLVKSKGYTETQIRGGADPEKLRSPGAEQKRTDAALTLASYRRPLENDPQALKLLELHLKGVEKRADQASEMTITEQEVTNIKKRLIYKIHRWEQSFGTTRISRKKV